MEQARNTRLDNICEGIAEERSVMNKASIEEKSLIATALQEMHTKGITVYKRGGVELVRVPGVDKLRVRMTKDDGDAEVSKGRTTSTNPDDEDGVTVSIVGLEADDDDDETQF